MQVAKAQRPEVLTASSGPPAGGGRGGLPASWPQMVVLLAAVAILYMAREVLIPLAIAVLLTFALAPVVSMIRRLGVPRTPAVIAAVAAAFILISAFSFLVVSQVSELARQLPTYQANILTKIRALKDSGDGTGVISQITQAIERVGREIRTDGESTNAAVVTAKPDPLLVQIYAPEQPIQMLASMIAPLIGPLATAGLVIVVVIFMLLEREDLRDRFIRLVGYSDLHRTTEALQDAGKRVGRYLLMQLVVNVTYGVPVALGLWWIGIPNAMLWGALCIVLRFVPYIGPVVSMVLPLFLSVAVSPDWSMLIWVAALFLTMELISNNIVEPWLYGSRTGLSPLAIIVAAIFWTWLWGPIGLVMSTPLTVCLVVLGKHVPQFRFFEVLFGTEPVLDPDMRLYQRLLANDPGEATDQLGEMLEEESLTEVYGSVGIPALVHADRDRARGVMTPEQLQTVAAAATTMIAQLGEIAEAERDRTEAGEGEDAADDRPAVLCVGGRNALDAASAAMLAQILDARGARALDAGGAGGERLGALAGEEIDTVVVCLLNPGSLRHGRFLVRRIRRQWPRALIGIALWRDEEGPVQAGSEAVPEADFVSHDLAGAVLDVLGAAGEPARSAVA